MTSELHPNQFQVNEAWIVFQLNDSPIHTEQEGSFNCICLMDAASCFLLGSELIPIAQGEPSQTQAHQMLTAAWAKKGEFPQTLFIPTGRFSGTMKLEAERLGMAVIIRTGLADVMANDRSEAANRSLNGQDRAVDPAKL